MRKEDELLKLSGKN